MTQNSDDIVIDFESKYRDADLKRVDYQTVGTVEECDWLMNKLDEVIGDIDDQISMAKVGAVEGDYADPDWFHAARRALKGARATRQAIQSRRGALRRKTRNESLEAHFMDAAMILLDKETVKKIWDLAHRRMGE